MSQYATKRAQEAAERYDVAYQNLEEVRNVPEVIGEERLKFERVAVANRKLNAAYRELEETFRTEQLVASGDAVDVSSLLDGAL